MASQVIPFPDAESPLGYREQNGRFVILDLESGEILGKTPDEKRAQAAILQLLEKQSNVPPQPKPVMGAEATGGLPSIGPAVGGGGGPTTLTGF